MPADLRLVPSEPRQAKDDIKFVIQVQYDEVIIILDFLQCIGNTHYTLHNRYGCACREAYRHIRWRDLALNIIDLTILQRLTLYKVVQLLTSAKD